MSILQFKNNATTTLSGSINDSQTSITVANSGQFPVPTAPAYFYVTMYEVSGDTEINIEIVKVTAVVGTTWTVVRAQDGTTARARSGISTVYIELRWTAASAAQMLQKDANLGDLSNSATARTNLGLGTMATQAASNVNITGGTISGVSIQTLDSTTTISDNADTTKKVAFEVSGVATGTTRTLTIPNASGTIALTSDLTAGYQPLDSDLTALAGLAANGIIARTAAGTMAVRTIGVPAAGLSITNGDGVSGNPTLALADDLAAVEGLSTTGFVRRTALNTWSASAIVDADLPSALTGKTYNALSLTANATGFSVAGGTTSKTLTVSNNLTLAGTDGTTITLPSVSGTVALNNQSFFIGTTSVAINRQSASLSLTGVSIDGSAGSAASATSATTATNLAGGSGNRIAYQTAASTTSFIAAPATANTYLKWDGSAFAWATPASGSVTSVGVSSSDLAVTGSPITSAGTIGLSLNTVPISKGGTGATTKTAGFNALAPGGAIGQLLYHDGANWDSMSGNTSPQRMFLRSSGDGTTAEVPVWDTLVDGDLPYALTGKTYNGLTLTANTTGFQIAGGTTSKTLAVSNNLTLAGTDGSTLNIGAGGTLGSAAFTASTAYAPAAGSSSITTVGTITSGTWTGSTIGISSGGTGATSATAAFDALSPATTLGDLIYHNGTDNVRLAGSTTAAKRFLTQTGTGSVSAAPGWNAIVDGDIPSALTGKTYNALSLTANATGFSVAGGTTSKTLTVSNNLTLAGADGSTLNIGSGGTLGTGAFATIANYLTTASAASTYAPLANPTFTGTATTPNLTFNTAGGRIKGDLSSATLANRIMFQSSTTNGNSTVSVLPNGTATVGQFQAFSSSDPANASVGSLQVDSTYVSIISGNSGTGVIRPFRVNIGASQMLTLDTAGNLGLGVTTSASSLPTIQSLYAIVSGSLQANTVANAYYSGEWKYVGTGAATQYQQSAGIHQWYTAPSGTAGNVISFTQAMTLDASGNLDIGTTGTSDRYQNIIATSAKLTFNAGTGFTGSAATSVYNQSAIPLVFGTNNTERARIDSSGNLLVGRTSTVGFGSTGVQVESTGQLVFFRTQNSTVQTFYNFSSQAIVGTISIGTTTTSYNTSSDYRLKHDIAPMQNALQRVAALKPVTYKWNADGSDGEGFIAHELAEVCPQAVTGEKDAVDADGKPVYQGIDTSFLVATLTAAIQEQQAMIQSLQARLSALEKN